MSKFTVSVAAMAATALFASSALAAPAQPPLMVSYATDGQLTCDGLLLEAGRMDEIMGISAEARAQAEASGTTANLATSAVINGALYSGALGRVPGLGMFANAAGAAAKRRAEEQAKAQEERIRTAESRRSVMMALYTGKNCGQPAVAAAPAPASAPVQPVATPVQ